MRGSMKLFGQFRNMRAGSLGEAGEQRKYTPKELDIEAAFRRGVLDAQQGESRSCCTYRDPARAAAWERGWESVRLHRGVK